MTTAVLGQGIPRRMSVVLSLFVAVVAGCGNSEAIMERMAVEGTASMDDMPLPYGLVRFDGPKNEKEESAKSDLQIVDGEFTALEAGGPAPGENQVQVVVYEGSAPAPPANEDDDEPEPVITGYWTSKLTIEAGKPVTIAFKSSELTDIDGSPLRNRRKPR